MSFLKELYSPSGVSVLKYYRIEKKKKKKKTRQVCFGGWIELASSGRID